MGTAVAITYLGEVINVEYRPELFRDLRFMQSVDRIGRSRDPEEQYDLTIQNLTRLVVSWDLGGVDRPLPIEEESIRDHLSDDLVATIVTGILEDNRRRFGGAGLSRRTAVRGRGPRRQPKRPKRRK